VRSSDQAIRLLNADTIIIDYIGLGAPGGQDWGNWSCGDDFLHCPRMLGPQSSNWTHEHFQLRDQHY